MAREAFIERKFSPGSVALIAQAKQWEAEDKD